MARPIAICPTHGPFSSMAFNIAAGPVRLEDCAESCPLCGAVSPIPSGTYSFVGNVLEAIRSATEADVRALRQVAKEAKEGAVNDNQARAKAAAINPAFVSITASTEVQIALWALLFAILSFYLQLCASWSDDQSSATAHQDARNQLQATKSLERVQEKIHAELRRQADAATAKAQAQQVLPASLTQTPEPIVNRHERRKAARLAKMKR